MSYKLTLDVFEGPLDLLLYLIKKSDIEICDIPIAEITDQYMEYIEMMKMLDLEVVGEFLVMAATLMQIKSRMLLPADPNEEEDQEDDPRDELVKRLQEYKVFKEVAERLKTKEVERQHLFSRRIDEEKKKEIEEDSKEVYFEASLFDLISAFTKALNKFHDNKVYEVQKEDFTVEDKIHDILHQLIDEKRVYLSELITKSNSRLEIIVSFMAILELIRLKEIRIVQKRIFAEIEIMRNIDNIIPHNSSPETENSSSIEQNSEEDSSE